MSGLTDATPTRFEEAICMRATFTASAARVAELLPDPRLRPLTLWPGRALVTIAAHEHRLCDLGPFGELSIAAHVRFGRSPIPGLSALARLVRRSFEIHPLGILVTAQSVRDALARRHGLAARVADVSFRQDGPVRECAAADGRTRILTLRCAPLRAVRPRRMEVTLYTTIGERLASTLLEATQGAVSAALDAGAARLELEGDHPVAHLLALLDLDPRPAAVSTSRSSQAILHRLAYADGEDGRRAA